jgi:flagellar basal body-associated protein FliL
VLIKDHNYEDSQNSGSSKTAIIVGSVVGCVVIIAAIGIIVFCVIKSKKVNDIPV